MDEIVPDKKTPESVNKPPLVEVGWSAGGGTGNSEHPGPRPRSGQGTAGNRIRASETMPTAYHQGLHKTCVSTHAARYLPPPREVVTWAWLT